MTIAVEGRADPAPSYSPHRDPSYRTEGAAIARLAEHMGKPLMPHQRHIVDVATEYRPETGYKYGTVVVVLPRQSGKTTLVGPVQAHRMIRNPRSTAFYTAQTGKDARRRFADFLSLWAESPLQPLAKPRYAAGSEGLHFPNGSSMNVFAPTRTALHGETPRLVTVDEFWSLDKADGDALLGAIGPAQITIGSWAQTWLISTMGTMQSEFMNEIVDRGRAGTDPSMCYIDYSLADGLDSSDPANWTFHPALGHTITLEDLEKEHRRQSPSEWERAYMNRRPEHSEPPAIPTWDQLPTDQVPPDPATRVGLGFEVGIEGTVSAIVAGWVDETGENLRVIKQAPGSWWLIPELTRLAVTFAANRSGPVEVVADDAGPVRRILADLDAAIPGDEPCASLAGVPLRRLSTAQRSIADMGLIDAATESQTLRPDGTEALAKAVALARLRTVNGVSMVSRDKSAGPVPALIAGSAALFSARQGEPVGAQIW